MFRKILFAAIATLALLSPLALPAASDAAPVRHNVGRYHAYNRGWAHNAWRSNGHYRNRAAAYNAARHMRMHGYYPHVR